MLCESGGLPESHHYQSIWFDQRTHANRTPRFFVLESATSLIRVVNDDLAELVFLQVVIDFCIAVLFFARRSLSSTLLGSPTTF
jgi:hypothetical protein